VAQENQEWTTITVHPETKEKLDKERGSTPWSAYLEELRKAKADPITLNDAQEIADILTDEIETGVDYAEIESRVKRAIEEARQ